MLSLLSTIAPFRFRVYVVFGSRALSKVISSFFPTILDLGFFSRGGERKMSVAVFMITYSLNSKSILPFSRGKDVAPGRGLISTI